MKEFKIMITVIAVMLVIFLGYVFFAYNTDEKTVSAVATGKQYNATGDFCSMEFETEDGNKWLVDYAVCPVNAKCKITFDTKGTKKVEDDEIVKIESVVFENGK